MDEPELRITDYHELLALHRALIEAKFNLDPNDRDVAGSPFVAKVADSVVDVLIARDADSRGDSAVQRWNDWLSIDETRREWKIASLRALGVVSWDGWTKSEKLDYSRVLLSPFRPTAERLHDFVAATSSQVTVTINLVKSAASGDEGAYQTLLDAPHEDLEVMISRYRGETSPTTRATIVEAVGNHRRTDDLYFLVSAMDDEAPEVWKQALDGLVTLGGRPARAQLQRLLGDLPDDDERTSWLQGALAQLDGGVDPDVES